MKTAYRRTSGVSHKAVRLLDLQSNNRIIPPLNGLRVRKKYEDDISRTYTVI